MTIRMLQSWNGLTEQSILTLGSVEEARLVGLGFASFDLDGASSNTVGVVAKTNQEGVVTSLQTPSGQNIPIKARNGRQGTQITDFSAIGAGSNQWSSSNGVVALVDSQFGFGAKDMTFVPGSSWANVKKTLTTTFSIQSGTVLTLKLKIPGAAILAGSPYLNISFSSDAGATKKLSMDLLTAYCKEGWNTISFRAGEDGTLEYANGNTWTSTGAQVWGDNFNFIDIVAGNLSGQTITFGELSMGLKPRPMAVWTFDVTGQSDRLLANVAPIFKSYGWSGTAFGDSDQTASFASNFKKLRDVYGFDVGSQILGHKDLTIPANTASLPADFDTANALSIANGLGPIIYVGCPNNASNPTIDGILAGKGVKWRGASGSDLLIPEARFIPNSDGGMIRQGRWQHLAQNYDSGTVHRQVKNRIAALRTFGGVLSLFTHNESSLSSDWTLGGDLSQLYKICDDLYESGVEVVNLTTALQRLGTQVFY